MRRITSTLANDTRSMIEGALGEWAKTNGLELKVGSIAFTPMNMKVPLTLSAIDQDTGVAQTPEVRAYEQRANAEGFPSGWCGKKVLGVTLLGWRPRARLYKLLFQRLDGKQCAMALNGRHAVELRRLAREQVEPEAVKDVASSVVDEAALDKWR